jgi:hypothetical protein
MPLGAVHLITSAVGLTALAITQASKIIAVPGVTVAGALPEALYLRTTSVGAVADMRPTRQNCSVCCAS